MLESLDAEAVRRWCAIGLASLRRHQHEIDELNVYPVPDGDTGTNLVLTFTSAHEHLAGAPSADLAATLAGFARGALLGARGNSGVIASQLLQGLADSCRVAAVTGRSLAIGLTVAADAAYRAVADPVEGTMLTVARAAGLAAVARNSDVLGDVATASAAAAAEALAHTPEQLPVLARAGVVDAGGRGLVVLFDALVEVITGRPPAPVAPAPHVLREVARETGSGDYAYEVQFLLDAPEVAVDELRTSLGSLGDSLVVVGAGHMGARDAHGVEVPTWNVHVHVNDVGAAFELAVPAGRPHRISVTHFESEQMSVKVPSRPKAPPAPAAKRKAAPTRRATVVVATGDGLAALFAAEGAAVVPGPSPSTGEILEAIRATGATRVVVLPNVAATQATAASAATEARKVGVRVSIVPTRSPVQVLAALAVRDDSRRFDDDVIAMAEAAGACRYAEIAHASREALTMAGQCQPGDVLALIEGEVNLIGQDLAGTCRDLLDRLLAGGGELITLLLGNGAPPDLGDLLQRHLTERWPFVEAHIYQGGQPHHPLLVGVE